ncbi:MAG: hypothetical protein KDA42_09540 [Planctomycetales bacterium]|nr:hypothetical protein [Planctomycetales bacterium]
MSINARELKRLYELDGPQKTVRHLREAMNEGHLRPQDFSLRELAESLVPDGHDWVASLDPRRGGATLLEAGEGVDLTAFSNIAGQIVYTRIKEAFDAEDLVGSRLVDTIPTKFDGEKIPSVGQLGDKAEIVHPGMPYPHVGFGEDYIETPSTTKRGFIVPVTREAIFFDRTNLVLRNASMVGESLALNKEKRILDVIIGATNNYKWRGTAYDTYQTASPWDNVVASNALADWTNVDAVEQAFADITDPNTGEPILLRGNTLLVAPQLRATALRIVTATEVRSGDITAGSGTQTIGANPVSYYGVESSRLLKARLDAASIATSTWFAGDFRKAFAYMENWPITVTQAPPNSEAEFNQDIVMRFKASERGAAAVLEPRAVVKCTA